MTGAGSRLRAVLGADRVREAAPLAPFTTFRCGGPAEYLVEARSAAEVDRALAAARELRLPVTVIGGGSNVLVADRGLPGLVLRMRGGEIHPEGETAVRADAGVTINGLVRWTISQGLAGLESWAGTPGTVGGAVRGNAHFAGRNIGDLVERVTVISPEGAVSEVHGPELEFAYDYSRVQRTGEVVLSAAFRVEPGDRERLRAAARDSLAYRKRTQPLAAPSAGCIFQNPDPSRDAVPAGIPCSAGALVDRAGLKGLREGGASVSATHANFIVSDGRASAADIRRLIDRCKDEVFRRFGVELREEIVYLGFA